MEWSFEEFNKLCQTKHLDDTYIFQKALYWKIAHAFYHAERSKDVWKELLSSKESISVGGVDWNKTQLASEAEAEACAQVLNSMPDILAQIINTSLLKGFLGNNYLHDDKVKIFTVRDKIHKLPNDALKLENEINNLLSSDEFQYIRSFVNTIKHHSLIDSNWSLHMTANSTNQGVHFVKFDKFKDQFAVYITEECRKKIVEQIIKIGNEINNYLKKC
jgi:hypothetical protein